MSLKLVALLGLVCVALAVSPPRVRFTARRAGPIEFTCPNKAVDPKEKFAGYKVESDARVEWSTDKWVFNKKAFSNLNGESLDGKEMVFFDLCKASPNAVCKLDKSKFCKLDGAKTLCCPLHQGDLKSVKGSLKKGCPKDADVNGMPRSFMPQLIKPSSGKAPEEAFVAWVNGGGIPNVKDFKIEKASVEVAKLLPSQDEIFGDASANKVCDGVIKGTGSPSGTPSSMPLVCSDDFIYDGHHRWSQAVFCSWTKDCKAPTSLDVYKASLPCHQLIGAVQDFIDWSDDKTKDFTKTEKKKAKAVDKVNIEFSAFTELEERFGRTAHESMEQAGMAFVEQTRARLASIGMELKGGDEALRALWEHRHAPKLWQ